MDGSKYTIQEFPRFEKAKTWCQIERLSKSKACNGDEEKNVNEQRKVQHDDEGHEHGVYRLSAVEFRVWGMGRLFLNTRRISIFSHQTGYAR